MKSAVTFTIILWILSLALLIYVYSGKERVEDPVKWRYLPVVK